MVVTLGAAQAQTEQRIFFETKDDTYFIPLDSSYRTLYVFQKFLEQNQGTGLAEIEKAFQTDSSFASKLSAIDLDGDTDLDIIY
jgi:hypothetical protein